MPLHPNVRQCTHIQVTGHRCGSPALKHEYFCYFHTRMIKGVQTPIASEIYPVALIENAEAIQAALMHMIDAVLKGTLDNKRASLVLKALQIAVRNSRHAHFDLYQHDMVHQVPNYAAQYLTEHPELTPPEPSGDSRPTAPAEPSSLEPCHPQEAQAFAQRRPAHRCHPEAVESLAKPRTPNEGSLHSSANAESHPERARTSPEPSPAEPCHPEEAQALAKRRPAKEGSLHSPANAESHPEPARTPPLTHRQSERWNEIKKLEASIEGAMQGNWRDLRTVFNAIGLAPPKRAPSHRTKKA